MLNLDQYTCLGAALREALDRWPNETCLIESDRDKEKTRLTYSDFKEMALPLARALEDAEFSPGDRAAIIMTNQSKWLISAYAIFHGGRRAGAARLQADRGRASAIAGAQQGEIPGDRILPVARDHAGARSSKTTKCKPFWSPKRRRERTWRAPSAGKSFAARAIRCLFRASVRTWPASSIPREPAAVPRDACSRMRIIWSNARR